MVSVRDHRQLRNERLVEHESGSGRLEKIGNSFTTGSQTPDFLLHSLFTKTEMKYHVFLLYILHFWGAFPKKLSITTVSFVMFVCPSETNSATTGRICVEFNT